MYMKIKYSERLKKIVNATSEVNETKKKKFDAKEFLKIAREIKATWKNENPLQYQNC